MAPKAEDPSALTEEVPVFKSTSKDEIAESPSSALETLETRTEIPDKVEGEKDTPVEASAAETPVTTEEVPEEVTAEKSTEQAPETEVAESGLAAFSDYFTNLLSSIPGSCCGLNGVALDVVDQKPETDESKIKDEKAVQIQKVVRGKLARKATDAMKQEIEKPTEEAPESSPETQEGAPEEAPSKPAKKSLLRRFRSLFSVCKQSDRHVVVSERASL